MKAISHDGWHHLHNAAKVNRRAALAARRHRLRRRILIRLGTDRADQIEAFESPRDLKNRPHIYLSAGIHGDEAGGVEGLIRWMEGAPAALFRKFQFTIIPCLNPVGLRLNQRWDEKGRDLNRLFHDPRIPAIGAVTRYLEKRGPFALAFLSHEDFDACGAYLYELAPKKDRWGEAILKAASSSCPTDPRPKIEGRRAQGGVIVRNVKSAMFRAFLKKIGTPEAAWLALRETPRAYTFETPSEFDLVVRAEAHRAAIATVVKLLGKTSRFIPGPGKARPNG